jgi:hypothetical protein
MGISGRDGNESATRIWTPGYGNWALCCWPQPGYVSGHLTHLVWMSRELWWAVARLQNLCPLRFHESMASCEL